MGPQFTGVSKFRPRDLFVISVSHQWKKVKLCQKSSNPFFLRVVFVSSSSQRNWNEAMCVTQTYKKTTGTELTLHLPWSLPNKASFLLSSTGGLWQPPIRKLRKSEFNLHNKITSSPDCGYKAICFTYSLEDYTKSNPVVNLWELWTGNENHSDRVNLLSSRKKANPDWSPTHASLKGGKSLFWLVWKRT